MKWFTEEEFLEITVSGNSNVLNEVLDRVYNKAIEQALCHIPDMVNKLSKKVNAVTAGLNGYFAEHKEFLDYKDIVIKAVQQMEIEYTGMSFEDILEKATPLIEKRIKLIKEGGSDASA